MSGWNMPDGVSERDIPGWDDRDDDEDEQQDGPDVEQPDDSAGDDDGPMPGDGNFL